MRLSWTLQPSWQPLWQQAWLVWTLQVPSPAWAPGAPCKYHGSSTVCHRTHDPIPKPHGQPLSTHAAIGDGGCGSSGSPVKTTMASLSVVPDMIAYGNHLCLYEKRSQLR